jgi:hypothetical protein
MIHNPFESYHRSPSYKLYRVAGRFQFKAFGKMTLRIVAISIRALGVMTFDTKTALNQNNNQQIGIKHYDNLQNGTLQNGTQHNGT